MEEGNDILLAKWLAGELSEEEMNALKDQYDLDSLKEILSAQEQLEPEIVDSQDIWVKIKAEHEETTSLDPNTEVKKRRKVRYAWMVVLLLICAIVAILYGLLHNSTQHIETDDAKTTPYLFAEGSSATIGPRSTLRFDTRKWENERTVYLKGQASFNVEKGVPFIVETTAGKVEVLGTEFDVWSIDKAYMRVSCTEGSVRVSDQSGTSKVLSVGEYVYIANERILNVEQNVSKEKDWLTDFRNYKTTPIRVVLSDLERFYALDFEIEEDIKDDVFSGVLPINDRTKCIQYIETSLSYESSTTADKIVFKKRK